jgi:hypothetical protein
MLSNVYERPAVMCKSPSQTRAGRRRAAAGLAQLERAALLEARSGAPHPRTTSAPDGLRLPPRPRRSVQRWARRRWRRSPAIEPGTAAASVAASHSRPRVVAENPKPTAPDAWPRHGPARRRCRTSPGFHVPPSRSIPNDDPWTNHPPLVRRRCSPGLYLYVAAGLTVCTRAGRTVTTPRANYVTRRVRQSEIERPQRPRALTKRAPLGDDPAADPLRWRTSTQRYPLGVGIASGSRLTLAALAILIVAGCDAPIGAIRRSPPGDLAGRVLATRSKAPPIALEGTQGPYRLADTLAQGPALLVFYRGHW